MKTIIAAIIATTFAMGTAFAQTPATSVPTKIAAPAVAVAAKTTASVTAASTTAVSAMPTAPSAAVSAAPASQAKTLVPGEKSKIKHHMDVKKDAVDKAAASK